MRVPCIEDYRICMHSGEAAIMSRVFEPGETILPFGAGGGGGLINRGDIASERRALALVATALAGMATAAAATWTRSMHVCWCVFLRCAGLKPLLAYNPLREKTPSRGGR
jgi:hypothetical protein